MVNRNYRAIGWAVLSGCMLVDAASAADVSVIPGIAVYNSDGFVRIAGEVRNNTGQTICTPQVEVFLMDAGGKPVGVKSIVTETKAGLGQQPTDGVIATRQWLPAGEVAVFTYLRDRKSLSGAAPAKHELSASARQCDGALPKISVEGFTDKVDATGYHAVAGVLRNTGNIACRSPKIVLGMYDASGKLLEATYIEPDEYFQKKLEPGKTVRFSQASMASPDWGKFASFKYWGDCASHEP